VIPWNDTNNPSAGERIAMSSKGKKNRNNGSGGGEGQGQRPEGQRPEGQRPEGQRPEGHGAAAAPSAPKAARKPIGTVPERLVGKADQIYGLVNDALQLMTKRDAPAAVTTATKTFMAQVEVWRESVFALKASGWVPPEASASKDIVEGDGVRIAKDQHETYKYIFEALGVEAGAEELVAGPVTTTGRLARVLVRSNGTPGELDGLGQPTYRPGQVFGYVSRTHLVKR
jgi:hypothetical protein